MNNLPTRKLIRIENFDYSTPGSYFITICTANREKIFWNGVGADIIRPQNVLLSPIGKIAEQGILQMADLFGRSHFMTMGYEISRITTRFGNILKTIH